MENVVVVVSRCSIIMSPMYPFQYGLVDCESGLAFVKDYHGPPPSLIYPASLLVLVLLIIPCSSSLPIGVVFFFSLAVYASKPLVLGGRYSATRIEDLIKPGAGPVTHGRLFSQRNPPTQRLTILSLPYQKSVPVDSSSPGPP